MRPSFLRVSFTLGFLFTGGAAQAGWSSSGLPLCTAPGYQGSLVGLPFPSASGISSWQSLFALWSDTRDTLPAGSDLYVGLTDPFGNVSPPDGDPAVLAPGFQGYADACFVGTVSNHPPSNHGVVVAWDDDRNAALDIYAQRVVNSGLNIPWPAGGVPVCLAPGVQSAVRMVGHPDGGTSLAWLDDRGGFQAIYAQRLDGDGNALWAADGIAVCDVPAYRLQHRLVEAPDGGIFSVWMDDQGGGLRVRAARLLPDGARAVGWPASGLLVSSLPAVQLGPAVADGAGGVYVTFYAGDGRPVACRVDVDAQVHAGWPADGVALAQSSGPGTIEDAIAYQGGVVAIWRRDVSLVPKVPDEVLLAQRLAGDGSRPAGWDAEGNLVSATPHAPGDARLAAGAPAIVATWADRREPGEAPDLFAMRLLDDGSPSPNWTSGGVVIAQGGGAQFSPRPVWDGLGGVMIAYVDDHDFNSFEPDLYVQRVTLEGQVGTVGVTPPQGTGLRLAEPVPNPARTAVTLAIAGAGGTLLGAEVLDAAGRRVRSLGSGFTAGAALRWDLADDSGRRVPPGLYILRVRARGECATRAVIVRR